MNLQQTPQLIHLSKSNPVTGISSHPLLPSLLFVAAGQGQLIVLILEPFQIRKVIKVFNQYSMCVMPHHEGLLLGSSNGQLAFINLNYEIEFKKKIHNDCLSCICQCGEYLITTGYDGLVCFLNKKTFEEQKKIQFETPIWNCHSFESKIYVAGNPSYQISSTGEEVVKLKRFDYFSSFNRKLYGCSDQRGLTCLSNNSNSYIPCNFILPLENNFLTFSDQCIGIMKHKGQMEWKCKKIKELENTTIKSGFSFRDTIVIGDDEGKIYKINYENVNL